jgi:hypothetical protein
VAATEATDEFRDRCLDIRLRVHCLFSLDTKQNVENSQPKSTNLETHTSHRLPIDFRTLYRDRDHKACMYVVDRFESP